MIKHFFNRLLMVCGIVLAITMLVVSVPQTTWAALSKYGLPGIYNSTALNLANNDGAALALDSSGNLVMSTTTPVSVSFSTTASTNITYVSSTAITAGILYAKIVAGASEPLTVGNGSVSSTINGSSTSTFPNAILTNKLNVLDFLTIGRTATTTLLTGNRGSATSTFYSDLWVPFRDLLLGGSSGSGNIWTGDGTATTSIRGGTAGMVTSTISGDFVANNFYSGSIQFTDDGGVIDAMTIPVSASAATTTKQGYNFSIDNIPVWNVMGSSDALGSVYNLRVGMTNDIGTATTTFQKPSANTTTTFYMSAKNATTKGVGTCLVLTGADGTRYYLSATTTGAAQFTTISCEDPATGLNRD